jgi:hypothetical protein
VAYRAASGNGCGGVGGKLDLDLVWRTLKWARMAMTIREEWLLWCKKDPDHRILRQRCARENEGVSTQGKGSVCSLAAVWWKSRKVPALP